MILQETTHINLTMKETLANTLKVRAEYLGNRCFLVVPWPKDRVVAWKYISKEYHLL